MSTSPLGVIFPAMAKRPGTFTAAKFLAAIPPDDKELLHALQSFTRSPDPTAYHLDWYLGKILNGRDLREFRITRRRLTWVMVRIRNPNDKIAYMVRGAT